MVVCSLVKCDSAELMVEQKSEIKLVFLGLKPTKMVLKVEIIFSTTACTSLEVNVICEMSERRHQ
jgi:hypothetical protein